MFLLQRLRRRPRPSPALLGLASAAALVASDASAQCRVTSGPALFDSLSSPGLPSHLRPTNDSMSLAGSARRLAVRYNYGYVIYGLAAPGSPTRTSYEDLYVQDGYPKSGDGQTRTGKIAISSDGLRSLVPWTDDPGFGTIVQPFGGTSFQQGGDYAPAGSETRYTNVARVGSRYIALTTSNFGLYVADVTTVPASGPSVKNGIFSEIVSGVGTDLADLSSVETGSKTWVVASSGSRVVVLDVTGIGSAGAGMTSGITFRSYAASELGVPGGAYINTVASAAHPTDGALHLLVEGYRVSGGQRTSTGVHLLRMDSSTGALTDVGSFVPATGENGAQLQTALVPFDTDVVAFLMHKTSAGVMKLQARSSLDFTKNLAEAVTTFSDVTAVKALLGFRSSGGAAHLYFADGLSAYALSLSCDTAPGPATAQLAVERVPLTGAATPVADGGSVFIGDEIRIKPAYAPPDSVSPLLDWRLDYDFHDGNAADSQAAAMRLIKADASRTLGPSLPPTSLTLIGPCDPAQLPEVGDAPNPATGAGCWTSVTTNGTYGIPAGTADFSASAPAQKELKVAFEVQNALNAGGSSVAAHRITWKVPQQLLKVSAILSGGSLEDASEATWTFTVGYSFMNFLM